MRAFNSLTTQDKERIYSCARMGITDCKICSDFDISEDDLLRAIDEVHVELQRRRGYQKIYITRNTKKG